MKRTVSAIITAAGDGTRMGGVSKPLIRLGKKTAFELVLDAFCASEYIFEIVVACRDTSELEPFIGGYSLPIKLVKGGKTRGESVWNAVAAAAPNTKAYAIHDCARPLIKTTLIDKIITAAFQNGAATAAAAVTDTIKYIDKDKVKTPKRSALLAVQTPQVFLRDLYLAAMAMAKKGGYTATDDTTLAEKAGFTVNYIISQEPNLKLTTPYDIGAAMGIIAMGEAE